MKLKNFQRLLRLLIHLNDSVRTVDVDENTSVVFVVAGNELDAIFFRRRNNLNSRGWDTHALLGIVNSDVYSVITTDDT